MLRSIGWMILLLMAGIAAQAQEQIGQPKVELAAKSPEVAKMQQFIDIPVSFFTGSANISIPVHTMTSKGNNVPITLDYHTGGIKAEEVSGYVGIGWTLTGGGMITRNVRGNRDEGIRYQMNPNRLLQGTTYVLRWPSIADSLAQLFGMWGGWYVKGGVAWDFPSLHSKFVTHNSAISSGNIPPSEDAGSSVFNGVTDGQPDLFYINCGSYSGKFIFDALGRPLLLPYNQDLTITPVIQTIDSMVIEPLDTIYFRQHYFASFKVSTPDGKDYYFGGPGNTVNLPNIIDGPQCIGGWLLTQIVDRATLDTITFTYAGASGGGTVVKNTTKFAIVGQGCLNSVGTPTESQAYTGGKPLKITSSKEVLDFYYSNGLDSIMVSDRITGTTYKKLQFDYRGLISHRSALAGFTVKDLKTNEYFPYSFNYYDTAGYRGIYAQDYWGYSNGANNGNNLYPLYPGCTTTAANRDPAWPAMKQDILTEVIYPTGGKTVIEYEPHVANTGRKPDNGIASGDAYFVSSYNNFSLPATIGGLRVKRMLIYDPLTKDTIIRRFSYLTPGSTASSGFLYIPPKLEQDVSFSCPASTPGLQAYLSNHPMYIGNGAGGNVTYTNVQMQEEKNGLINGHTEYDYYDDTNTDSVFYSNASTDTTNYPLIGANDVMPEFMFRILPQNFLAGKEKEKRVYNANGDLLSREKSIYKGKVYGNLAQCAIINAVSRDNICGVASFSSNGFGAGQSSGAYMARRVRPASHTAPPASYFSGTGVVPRLAPPTSFYFMYPYTMHKIAVQLYRKITENHPSTLAFTTDTVTYTYGNINHVNPTMTTTRNSKSEVTQQQTMYSLDFNDVNSGDSTFYFMRKAGMNLPVATFKYKNNNIIGGGYRQYKMRTRADSTIFLTSFESSLNVANPGIAPATINISGTLPQAFNFPAANFVNAATYKYNADNTVGYVTKKGSDNVVVLWDYNKNFVIAQATNCDSSDIAFTGFETSYNGNWTVAGTARVTTSAITGRQSYSLSSGNITKSGLNAAKTYIVSYWSLTTAATVNATAGVAGNVKKGWHYFEHKLPAATTSVTISGTVIIDELRIYPSDAQMTTYTFEPMLGMTATMSANNIASYYEYDGVGKLRFIRDADNNITKAAQYFYTVYGKDSAIWRSAGGATRYQPCPANTAYNTAIFQKQQIDINPNSSTFGNLRWSAGDTCGSCDISSWQDTATTLRCVKDANNNNTGYQEKKQKDMNPCSNTYNQARWVSVGLNTTACPIPPPPCTGADKMIINGVCVTGQRVNTGSVWNAGMGKYACTYHYEWLPDCIKGSDITEYNATPCSLGNACIPQ